MHRVIHYHHPQAEHFSLKYSSTSLSELRTRRSSLDGATKLLGYPFETPVYVLYEADTDIESAEDIDYDGEWLSERITELDREGQVVAFRLVELLEAAVDAREEDEFRLHKEFEPQKIQQAMGDPIRSNRTSPALFHLSPSGIRPVWKRTAVADLHEAIRECRLFRGFTHNCMLFFLESGFVCSLDSLRFPV